ncbi:MAG: 50S ribosomal protein L18 [Nitrospirae bacterium]|nr:MAG: 50S ribosomal protein L18 [Nitrospirota bacterium]
MSQTVKRRRFERRKRRVRKRVFGTPTRPRLNVYRSNAHIHAQIIDDTIGHTLVAASSCEPELRSQLKSGGNREAARAVGRLVAERARAANITAVVFDRGGRLYHGRVQALAEASREAGLEF